MKKIFKYKLCAMGECIFLNVFCCQYWTGKKFVTIKKINDLSNLFASSDRST